MSEETKPVSASGIDIIKSSMRREHESDGFRPRVLNSMEDESPVFGTHQPASRLLVHGMSEALGISGRENLMEEQLHQLQVDNGLADIRVSDSGFAVTEAQAAPAPRKPGA